MLGGERDDVEEEDDNHEFNVDYDDDMMVFEGYWYWFICEALGSNRLKAGFVFFVSSLK